MNSRCQSAARRRLRPALLALALAAAAGCCTWPPPVAPPLPPESRDPVAIANKLETLLTQDTPLRDESRTHRVVVTAVDDWRDPTVHLIWRQLAPRLVQRNPQIKLLAPPATGDYRLTVVVDRGVPPGTAEFQLRDAHSDAVIWKHREYLIVHE